MICKYFGVLNIIINFPDGEQVEVSFSHIYNRNISLREIVFMRNCLLSEIVYI